MLGTFLNDLFTNIAYYAYIRLYRINDEESSNVEVNISEFNNSWNRVAAPPHPEAEREPPCIESDHYAFVSEKNNSWNKIAVGGDRPLALVD